MPPVTAVNLSTVNLSTIDRSHQKAVTSRVHHLYRKSTNVSCIIVQERAPAGARGEGPGALLDAEADVWLSLL